MNITLRLIQRELKNPTFGEVRDGSCFINNHSNLCLKINHRFYYDIKDCILVLEGEETIVKVIFCKMKELNAMDEFNSLLRNGIHD